MKGVGKLDVARAFGEVPYVEVAHGCDMVSKGLNESSGQDGQAVLSALRVAYEELTSFEIDVLDAKTGAFEEAETGTVEEGGHHLVHAAEVREERGDLRVREHYGNALLALSVHESVERSDLDPEHLLVQEEEGSERLVLRRCAHAFLFGEMGEERGDVGST